MSEPPTDPNGHYCPPTYMQPAQGRVMPTAPRPGLPPLGGHSDRSHYEQRPRAMFVPDEPSPGQPASSYFQGQPIRTRYPSPPCHGPTQPPPGPPPHRERHWGRIIFYGVVALIALLIVILTATGGSSGSTFSRPPVSTGSGAVAMAPTAAKTGTLAGSADAVPS